MRRRAERARARHDARSGARDWVVKRRERTRRLIEYGGLVVKAKLPDLTDDDRAILYGAFLTVAIMLGGDQRDEMLALWRRRGKRAFDQDAARNGIDTLERK